jgi:DNA-binding CsgD family transcriptional regulator/tetratricopeptide (TPR) repeat protein
MAMTGEAAPKGVFVGRQPELDVLIHAWNAARDGTPQIVWVEGEPGIGKTAFIRRFLASLDDVFILEASGEEAETMLDYGVFLQLAAGAALNTSWRSLDERAHQQVPASAFAVGGELLEMFGALQDTAPVVIAIDDAQWADASTAAALLFALRRLHGDQIMVLIISRPYELDHLGPSWSRFLGDADRVERIRLIGLSAPEVGQLASSLKLPPLTSGAADRLQEHTSGHPLYVRALLNEVSVDRLNRAEGPLPAPHSFAATVLARLTELHKDAQELVAAAAVAGPRSPLNLAASVAGLDDPLVALEEALAAELLTLVPAQLPQQIALPHPLVRAAVYDDLSPSRRRMLHLACAKVSSGSESLAHRVAASGGADDALAGELGRSARAEIVVGHMAAGVERLLWASRIAASQTIRERSLLTAVEYLVWVRDVAGASSHRDAVLACSDSPRRSFVLALMTGSEGRIAEAEAACREVLARPDYALHPELERPVTASLALTCAMQGHGEEAVRWARRALEGAPTLGAAELVATRALAVGYAFCGRTPEGIAELEPVSLSQIEPEWVEAEMLVLRGVLKGWWGDLAGAVEDLSTAIRWSRAGVTLGGLPNAYGELAEVEYRLGLWDEGLAHADVAVSLAEDADGSWELPLAHAVASYLNGARGNWDAAIAHVESARRAAQTTPLRMCIYYACSAAAHLAWVRAEWDVVLRSLLPLGPLLGKGGTAGLGQRAVQVIAAEAMLGKGRLAEAQRMLDLLEAELEVAPQDGTRIELWRLRGMLAHARESPRGEASALERGQQAAAAVDAPLSTGLLELASGHILRTQGSRKAAIAALRAAAERFERLGAHPFVRRCEFELSACGVRSRNGHGDNRYGLTPREDVVARLVAAGKSNREVAGELYLSSKAIEYHLRNVYAKLNISSRRELAGRLS